MKYRLSSSCLNGFLFDSSATKALLEIVKEHIKDGPRECEYFDLKVRRVFLGFVLFLFPSPNAIFGVSRLCGFASSWALPSC